MVMSKIYSTPLIVAVIAFAVLQLAAFLLFFKPLMDENAGLRDDLGKLAERVDLLSDGTDRIAVAVGDASGSARMARLAALRTAMISGRPFAEYLAAVEAAHRPSEEARALLDAVRPWAPLGVATAADLRARYDRLPRMVADATPPSPIQAGVAKARRLADAIAESIDDRANRVMAGAEELIRGGREYVGDRIVVRFSPRLGAAIAPLAEAPAAAAPLPPPIDGKIRALLDAGDVAAARDLVAGKAGRPDAPTQAWLDTASAWLAGQRAAAWAEAEIRAARSDGS